ncbi:SDR family oxidoreductase [Clavibacter michiganensis]|nr:SDR family oxidoreductase [Clavibacter michiganensis]
MSMVTEGVAVVTGAGSGMGRSTAEVFLREGWTVIALDVAAVDEEYRGSGRIVSAVADVRSREAVRAALERALPNGRGIDVVANVAGIYPPSTLADFTEETYRRVFDVNVLGVLNVTAEAVSRMTSGAAVVNFASVDAFTVSPGQLLYGASKAAVVMLTKELALELAPLGIRVNGIAPGWVATPGNEATGRMDAAAASIPLGRVARPEEIAEWVWLLAHGSHASFMTGETLVLSGGDVMR